MIRLTRINHSQVVLNSDLIEHIDVTPDTVITLTTGQILRVLEPVDEVVRRIVDFRRLVHSANPRLAVVGEPDPPPRPAAPDEVAS